MGGGEASSNKILVEALNFKMGGEFEILEFKYWKIFKFTQPRPYKNMKKCLKFFLHTQLMLSSLNLS